MGFSRQNTGVGCHFLLQGIFPTQGSKLNLSHVLDWQAGSLPLVPPGKRFLRFSSVAQSCPTLRPQGLQHTRPPCPSPAPGACSNLCPSSRWCHPTISPSVVPFSCLQSFPASGSFPRSQFFASGGQSIGASASVLPLNIQDWFPLGWTGLISLQSKGISRVFSNNLNSLALNFLYGPILTTIHDYWKSHSFD